MDRIIGSFAAVGFPDRENLVSCTSGGWSPHSFKSFTAALKVCTPVPGLILKDFHAREPLEFCFIEYSFSVIRSPREPHFPNRSQRYVLDSTRLPF